LNSKKWIKIFFILPLLLISVIGSFNYTIDPLWCFNHTNKFNKNQLYFNERQQKTNNVYFNGLNKYNGILFGSSRTTFINQYDFYNMNIYNYAMDSMYPFEYIDYLNLAKEVKGSNFKYVIIGADFYNTMQRRVKRFEDPSNYISKAKSPLYRYKMLLSLDTLKRSENNININLNNNEKIYYTRNNIKIKKKVSEQERLDRYTKNIKRHTENFIGDNYHSNKDYIDILKKLKKDNPNTKFIIFTSPITANLLVSIIKNGHKLKEFEKWLRDMIEIYGEVNHFMSINTITTNLENYSDDDHAYPHIGKLLANKISFKKNSNIPNDFGILLNKSNIDEYMYNFKQQLRNY